VKVPGGRMDSRSITVLVVSGYVAHRDGYYHPD
jgi:hypothetical protein